MKRKLSFLFCLLLVISSFSACSEKASEENDETQANASGEETSETAAETEEETESFTPDLPNRDFGGEGFTFITKSNSAFGEWAECSIWSDGYTGEVLNDAVYDRNLYISATYNAEITVYEPTSDTLVADVRNAVTAGDSTYDVAMPALNQAGAMVKKWSSCRPY